MMGVLGYIENGTFRLPQVKSGSDMRASVLTWIQGAWRNLLVLAVGCSLLPWGKAGGYSAQLDRSNPAS